MEQNLNYLLMYYKKLFGIFIALSAVILLSSCEQHEYYDVAGVENGAVYCWSEGVRYDVDLKYFSLCDSDLYFTDSITLDDAVATANNGFEIRRGELTDVSEIGNYEIRQYQYNASYVVYITSFAHEVYYRHLPFSFVAKELWLNETPVTKQPLVFERSDAEVTELPVSEDEDKNNNNVYAKYLIRYAIDVYYGYDAQKIGSFDLFYEITRKNESVWNNSNGDITVTVTYDWKPE